jgi:predicted amidohydrolase YtcJ
MYVPSRVCLLTLDCIPCADGSLGSRTALFHEPYADQPGSSGTRTIEAHRLRQLVTAADAAGLQVAVHAIGDRAVDEVLQVYADLAANSSSSGSSAERGQQQQGQQGRRAPHRVEHAQHISGPAAASRMAAAGVAATPNPLHLLADVGVLQARLGAERAGAGRAYAFRTLLGAGVTAAFASDWPVVPLEPLAGAWRVVLGWLVGKQAGSAWLASIGVCRHAIERAWLPSRALLPAWVD